MPDANAPSLRHQLALAAAITGGVALLSAIIAGLGADEQWEIDPRVRAVLARRRHPRIRAALAVAGHAGTAPVYLPAAAIIATVLAYDDDVKATLPVITTVAMAAGAALAVKHIVRRPRPVIPDAPTNERYSFPSGHTTRATATAFVGAYLLVRERLVPAAVAMPAALAIAVTTGVSRTYADAHWTTDVIGGWALGGATAAAGALWYESMRAEGHVDDE